jgi:hypothetical protein
MTTEAHEHRIIEISRKAAWEMGAEFRYTPREDSPGPDSLRGNTFIEPAARNRLHAKIGLSITITLCAGSFIAMIWDMPRECILAGLISTLVAFASILLLGLRRQWPIYTIKSHIEFRLIEAGYRIYVENGQLHIDAP